MIALPSPLMETELPKRSNASPSDAVSLAVSSQLSMFLVNT